MKIFAKIKAFFGKVPGTIKGIITGEELVRALVAAIASGSLSGALLVLIPVLVADVPKVISDPSYSGLVVAILTFVGDLFRRKAQGASVPLPFAGP